MRVPYEKPGLGVEPNWEALGEPEYTIEWERKSLPLNENERVYHWMKIRNVLKKI